MDLHCLPITLLRFQGKRGLTEHQLTNQQQRACENICKQVHLIQNGAELCNGVLMSMEATSCIFTKEDLKGTVPEFYWVWTREETLKGRLTLHFCPQPTISDSGELFSMKFSVYIDDG